MKREIKFRGLNENKKWYYGYLNIMGNGQFVILVNGIGYGAKAETIGQYTGLKDKNGKESYEGDIIKISYADWLNEPDQTFIGYVEYLHDAFKVKIGRTWFRLFGSKEFEIIGNCYENPSLLEAERGQE